MTIGSQPTGGRKVSIALVGGRNAPSSYLRDTCERQGQLRGAAAGHRREFGLLVASSPDAGC
jgi:hypothetical protein